MLHDRERGDERLNTARCEPVTAILPVSEDVVDHRALASETSNLSNRKRCCDRHLDLRWQVKPAVWKIPTSCFSSYEFIHPFEARPSSSLNLQNVQGLDL